MRLLKQLELEYHSGISCQEPGVSHMWNLPLYMKFHTVLADNITKKNLGNNEDGQ